MTNKLFKVNTDRFSPYSAYAFLVYFAQSSEPAAAVSRVSALTRTADVIEYRQGGDGIIRKGLGRMRYEPVTLERGISQNAEFMEWADAAQVLDTGVANTSLKNLRRNIRIELLNEARQPVMSFTLYRCWPSQFQALPQLDAGTNAIAIETIRLENEGWERALDLQEPEDK
ncbi:MAG TPA: phage tail protein [Gemmatimonadales bacterium]|nr:phage tail protein [Gemmatimonadales bacterium]